MSEFSQTKEKIQFHLGDILSLLHPHVVLYQRNTPPKKADGHFYPARTEDGIKSLIPLMEYITRTEIPSRNHPQTGKQQHDGRAMAICLTHAVKLLGAQYPQLVLLAQQFYTEFQSEPQQLAQGAQWLLHKTRELGQDYFDVSRVRALPTRDESWPGRPGNN